MTTPAKSSRIAVRLSPEQDALIRQAADSQGRTVTEFAVDAAVQHARDVLADRRLFVLDDAAWVEFQAVLDGPVVHRPTLEKLFAGKSIFQ